MTGFSGSDNTTPSTLKHSQTMNSMVEVKKNLLPEISSDASVQDIKENTVSMLAKDFKNIELNDSSEDLLFNTSDTLLMDLDGIE